MLKECEESSARLTDMLRDIEKQFKRRSTLVSSMETAELFYENQMDQATSVIEVITVIADLNFKVHCCYFSILRNTGLVCNLCRTGSRRNSPTGRLQLK